MGCMLPDCTAIYKGLNQIFVATGICVFDRVMLCNVLQTYGIKTRFFQSTHGFVALTPTKTELKFDFYDDHNRHIYSFVRHTRSTEKQQQFHQL